MPSPPACWRSGSASSSAWVQASCATSTTRRCSATSAATPKRTPSRRSSATRSAPGRLAGEEIVPAVRLVTLAQDVITFRRLGGVDAAVAIVRERAGGAYDPGMAERFCRLAPKLLAGLDEEPSWDAVLAHEPGGR